ncbi:hypothetical protein OP853_000018 [Salmonella enterica]|nr:hypothetical protein [Salmonella enterica]
MAVAPGRWPAYFLPLCFSIGRSSYGSVDLQVFASTGAAVRLYTPQLEEFWPCTGHHGVVFFVNSELFHVAS